jgi:putative heme-binding domain-containing protein
MFDVSRATLGSLLMLAVILSACIMAADDSPEASLDSLASLLELVIDADADTAQKCLGTLGEKIRTGQVPPATVDELKKRLNEPLGKILAGPADGPLLADAALVAAAWKDPAALKHVRKLAASSRSPQRQQVALETLVLAGDKDALATAESVLLADEKDLASQQGALVAFSRSDAPEVAAILLKAYPQLSDELKPQVIELLTNRLAWGKSLMQQIAEKKLPPQALNENQVRKLVSLGDQGLADELARHWGTIREKRDPAREQLVLEMRRMLMKTPGDAHRGKAMFAKLCGQCHKLHGEGQDVGPDITSNGRASFQQLLSNVFDPSLVIGASYQARTVRTIDGRVVTGLVVEDSEQRIVLKVQGGKEETIARDDVEAMKVSELSLMPEGIEKQYTAQELADLFAYISLDKPPTDPTARRIPGTPVAPKP